MSVVLVAAVAAAPAAEADGRISYTTEAGEMGQIEITERWRGDVLRIDLAGIDSYMLQRDDTIYAVTTMGGRTMVMDIGQMAGMAGAAGSEGGGPDAAAGILPESVEDIRETDETREIAGIEGRVHEIDWIDTRDTARTDTAVLTDDPRLLEHQALKMQYIRTFSGEAPNPLMAELEARGLAPLSFGDRLLLTDVGDEAGPAGDFELPAEPMDMNDMMQLGNQ